MNTEKVKEVLDSAVFRLGSASRKERQEVFDDLQSVLQLADLPEQSVCLLSSALVSTLPRYCDTVSCEGALLLAKQLVTRHGAVAATSLLDHLLALTSSCSVHYTPRTMVKMWLRCFGWSCLLLQSCAGQQQQQLSHHWLEQLVLLQARLVAAVVASQCDRSIRALGDRFSKCIKNGVDLEKYLNILTRSDSCIIDLTLLAFLLSFEAVLENSSIGGEFRSGAVALLQRVVLSARAPLPLCQLRYCCAPVLAAVTHHQFADQLLPVLSKGLLRSPELLLPSLAHVLAALTLDLSRYLQQLVPLLCVQLQSKEQGVREAAGKVLSVLAKHCSDSDAVLFLVDSLLSVVRGGQNKPTLAENKQHALSVLGCCSACGVTGSSLQQLAAAVCDKLVDELACEQHDATVAVALRQLRPWLSRLGHRVEPALIDCLQTIITRKNSSSAVRLAALECMQNTLRDLDAKTVPRIVRTLFEVLDRVSKNPTQVSVLCEGVVACLLMFDLARFSADHLDDLFKLAINKQYFFNDKFSSNIPAQAAVHLARLCERLLSPLSTGDTDHSTVDQQAVLSCLAVLAVRANLDVSQRRAVASCLPKVVPDCERSHELPTSFIRQLGLFLPTVSVQCSRGPRAPAPLVTSGSLYKCLESLLSLATALWQPVSNPRQPSLKDSLSRSRDSLVLSLLHISHHSALIVDYPNLWEKYLKSIRESPVKIIEGISAVLDEEFSSKQALSESDRRVIASLYRLSGDTVLCPMLYSALHELASDELLSVTFEQYSVYLTPDGVLYDQSVKNSLAEASLVNIKRESKLYSYQQQLEILSEQRERQKRLQQQGLELQALPAKQRKAVTSQLEKEGATRAKLTKMRASLERAVTVVQSLAAGNPQCLQRHYKHLLPALVKSLSSPLASDLSADLFRSLVVLALTPPLGAVTADSVAVCSLAMLAPYYTVPSEWSAEVNSVEFAVRLLTSVQQRCEQCGDLSASAFTALFVLIRAVLERGSHDTAVLELVHSHVQLRGESDLNDPACLPLDELLVLLLKLLGVCKDQSRKLLVATMLHLAVTLSRGLASNNHLTRLSEALHNPAPLVRHTALKSLLSWPEVISCLKDDGLKRALTSLVLILKFDEDADVKEEADVVWQALGSSLCAGQEERSSQLALCLIDRCVHSQRWLQLAASQALAAQVLSDNSHVHTIVAKLVDLYGANFKMSEPVLDEFDQIIVESVDLWEARAGVALALKTVGPLCPQSLVLTLMDFFVSRGVSDRSQEVRQLMLAAALACVDAHGKENVASLLPLFDQFFESVPSSGEFDSVRQAVVILMASLAKHMDKSDAKIKPIFNKLVQMLSIPAEQVQESAAGCLPALVPAVKAEVPAVARSLLDTLLCSDKFSERRGAAYGIAGLVKGSGILSLKQLDIMTSLIEAVQDKKDFRKREGALFAFTMLCRTLGRLFEPYIVHLLPHLLLCYGDQSSYVRDATDETARAVMSNLSTHGVKLVLPALLAALQEDSWRTKAGSVDLLGSMAFCAPKQLSSCLPSIVPQLIIVLGDSHQRVQKAGSQALKQIGSVIRNPEVQVIVPDLLSALSDPANKTSAALSVLIDTQFVHFIDAASLALIMPVVQRSFQDRSTEVRKMAAQIIGNMYSLTDQKDLAPYLPAIIPGLKSSLLDPVPEVRSKSARALGAMVRGIGECSFDTLLPWLMQTLTSEQNSVDRSGAAQGLSEVVGALGLQKLHAIMPDIIATASRSDIAPHARDGYIMLFIYMPMVFQDDFIQYIGDIIPPILQALTDETEYVRDTALRAGQRLVNTYADSSVQLLLPRLETGLFDENWRIRLSSIQLLGDLLYRVSGVSGKMTTQTAGEDDNLGTEKSQHSIKQVLGLERRNIVLAGLYMGRSDVAFLVRQTSLHVWKVVVSNTPRTLREILPTLLSLLLGHLASESHDKRQVAAHTLGDLVRKLGERVLVEILPILEQGLDSERGDERQGVCIGLSEIMVSTSREMILFYADSLVATVRRALVDSIAEVRMAAAKTFDSLHNTIGSRALNDILMPLISQLSDEDSEKAELALDGLRQVVRIKSRAVLPLLVPTLTAPPVNMRALSVLAQVAGDAITRHLGRLLPALLSVCERQRSECRQVLLAIEEPAAVATVLDALLAECGGRGATDAQRRAAAALLADLCRETSADLQPHESQLLSGFVQLFVREDQLLLAHAWDGLEAVLKRVQLTPDNNYVVLMRQAFRLARSQLSPGQLLPGLCLTKGIAALLPVYREAVLSGSPELKESAACGLSELVQLASVAALRTSVLNITGPLIRVLGDRFSPAVKVAVLRCLALLLEKAGILLRPFLPQLQTTFVKALSDGQRAVRLEAAAALGQLVPIQPRVDPLFTELANLANTNSDEIGFRETSLQALRNLCVAEVTAKMTPAVLEQVCSSLVSLMNGCSEDGVRLAAAGCLGQLVAARHEDELLLSVFRANILGGKGDEDWVVKHFRTAALYVVLKCSPNTVAIEQFGAQIERAIVSCLQSDRAPLVCDGVRAAAFLLAHQIRSDSATSGQILQLVAHTVSHSNTDVKQLGVQAVEVVARSCCDPAQLPDSVAVALLPMLLAGTREKNTLVRGSSESALAALLRLASGDGTLQRLQAVVDANLQESLQQFAAKIRRRTQNLSDGQPPQIDETLVV